MCDTLPRMMSSNEYEAKALECLALSDEYLRGANMDDAQVYATQAQTYAILAALHRHDDYNDDVELYNAEVDIYNRSHWGSRLWGALTRRKKA